MRIHPDILKHKLFRFGYFEKELHKGYVSFVAEETDKARKVAQELMDAHLREHHIERALRKYQRFHGIRRDKAGHLGPETERLLFTPRCGLPDFGLEAEERVCKWPMKDVTWRQVVSLNLSAVQVQAAFERACGYWNAACGIRLAPADDTWANIVARSGRGRRNNLDGRGGTLAWSYLPCGARRTTSLRQMYDTDEQWYYDMLVAVICHEVGHAIGCPHLKRGNLMQPYFSPSITRPQRGDIKYVVGLYGKPEEPPFAPPAGVEFGPIVLTLGGQRREYKVVPA